MRKATSKLLVGISVVVMLPISLSLTASAGSSAPTTTSSTAPTAPASPATSNNSGFVTVVPAASPEDQSTYSDSGSENLFYGTADAGTIGEEHLSWSLNLNGRQVQILQTFRNIITTYPEPETAADLSWQCWTGAGAVCVPPSGTLSGYDHTYGYTSFQVGYSYTPGDITTYSILPKVNGTYYIHLNWNWLALGYPNPSTSNGRFNATPIISAPIVCNYNLTAPCSFT